MRHALHLIRRDLVSNHRQPLIQLHSISIDDLAIEPARQLNRQLPAVISTVLLFAKRSLTSDLPVPVAPTMATKGCVGACAILRVLQNLQSRSMHALVLGREWCVSGQWR